MPIYTPQYDYRIKDSLPSGNADKVIRGTELMEEFENISSDLISFDNRITENARRRVVASLKWNIPDANGNTIRYGQNIKSVHNMESDFRDENGQEYDLSTGWGQCRVYFENLIPEFDIHYAILVQPYATSSVNSHVIATVNWQDAAFVQWAWGYLTNVGETFIRPPGPPAFSMLVVDAEQGEA